jgi:hypothetical protein
VPTIIANGPGYTIDGINDFKRGFAIQLASRGEIRLDHVDND